MYTSLQLLIQIIIPIALTVLIGKSVLNRINKNEENKKKLSTLNSELGLWSLPLFWMAISFPIFLFISFGTPIWITRELDISSIGYKEFISISTLPAILLATIIPLTAAISRAYSTHQTADQIGEMLKNKKRDISFKYKEEVTNQINNINERFKKESLYYKSTNDYFKNDTNKESKKENLEESIEKLVIAINAKNSRKSNSISIVNVFPLFHIIDHKHEENKLNIASLELITDTLIKLNIEINNYQKIENNNDLLAIFSALESLTSIARIIITDMYHSRQNLFQIKDKNDKDNVLFTIFEFDIYDYLTFLSVTSKIIIEIINLNYEYYNNNDENIGKTYDKLINIKSSDSLTGMRSVKQLLKEYRDS